MADVIERNIEELQKELFAVRVHIRHLLNDINGLEWSRDRADVTALKKKKLFKERGELYEREKRLLEQLG